ncbi:sugar transferase [Actinomyces capricornis]|nr:sugar transferase [Actinomyces capricornis]
MPSSTVTLPQTEQQQRSALASGTTTMASVPRSAWARMRGDLVTWLVLSDIAAVAVPTWIAALVGGLAAAWPVALTGAAMVMTAWFLGAMGMDTVEQGTVGAGRLVAATMAAIPVALLLGGDLSAPILTRTALVTALLLQGTLIIIGRSVESGWLHRRRVEGHGLRRTLIVMGSGAQPLLTQLRRHPMDGFLVVGYLSSGGGRDGRAASPVRSPEHIATTVRSERIDAVMTVGSVTPEDLVTIMRGLESTTVRLIVAPGLQDVVPQRMRGLSVTHGWTGLIAVKTRRTRAVGKALFDRVAGSLILVLASPVLAATAVALRLDSPGPVFYTQTRVGQDGKHFTMWKFRSMYIDSDARRQDVVAAGGDAGNEVMFKSRQDPRITRVGRIIRRLSIDELPQLLNVVRGEMSLVGPRPALPHEVAQYDAEALRRLLVKPGMTGLWQVSGRSDLSWASTVALDRHYVENRGGALDAKIFLGTLRAVIGGKGAY